MPNRQPSSEYSTAFAPGILEQKNTSVNVTAARMPRKSPSGLPPPVSPFHEHSTTPASTHSTVITFARDGFCL